MAKRNIYVASSWRNPYQQAVVKYLRQKGHNVYDFKNPPKKSGFSWAEISENWRDWSTVEYKLALNHPRAVEGFESDFNSMERADICVLVLPCGRSAHSEAGWMSGRYKKVYVLMPTPQEPELMYKLFNGVFTTIEMLELSIL